jgi:hypothetical protein
MITIVTFLWGDWGGQYATQYVNSLYYNIRKNTSRKFKFVCFSDRQPFNVNIKFKSMFETDKLKWNLRKQIMHREDPDLVGQIFAFDLDTIITGNLDDLFSYRGKFGIVQGVYPNRKDRPAGGILSFPAGKYHRQIWREVISNYKQLNQLTNGSERIMLDLLLYGERFSFWDQVYPGQILSYKEHINKGVDASNCRAVWFHGAPKPHELFGRKKDKWLTEIWKRTSDKQSS